MSEQYKPIPYLDTTFPLNVPTPNRERAIHAIQVRYPGVALKQRTAICTLQCWLPEQTIPELAAEPRISLQALKQLVERNESEPKAVLQSLNELVEEFSKPDKAAPPLNPVDYWYGLACVLFVGFDELKVLDDDAPSSDGVKKGELNFKEISRAYEDFMMQ